MAPPPMSLLDLSEFFALFVGEIGCDLLVRFHHDLMNAPTRVAPYFLELSSRLVDNWRNLRNLFRCETKLRPKAFFHSVANWSCTVNLDENVPSVKSTQGGPGDPTSDEYKDKSGNKFPLQRTIHCENTS